MKWCLRVTCGSRRLCGRTRGLVYLDGTRCMIKYTPVFYLHGLLLSSEAPNVKRQASLKQERKRRRRDRDLFPGWVMGDSPHVQHTNRCVLLFGGVRNDCFASKQAARQCLGQRIVELRVWIYPLSTHRCVCTYSVGRFIQEDMEFKGKRRQHGTTDSIRRRHRTTQGVVGPSTNSFPHKTHTQTCPRCLSTFDSSSSTQNLTSYRQAVPCRAMPCSNADKRRPGREEPSQQHLIHGASTNTIRRCRHAKGSREAASTRDTTTSPAGQHEFSRKQFKAPPSPPLLAGCSFFASWTSSSTGAEAWILQHDASSHLTNQREKKNQPRQPGL